MNNVWYDALPNTGSDNFKKFNLLFLVEVLYKNGHSEKRGVYLKGFRVLDNLPWDN